jgi:hypothetical protein
MEYPIVEDLQAHLAALEKQSSGRAAPEQERQTRPERQRACCWITSRKKRERGGRE